MYDDVTARAMTLAFDRHLGGPRALLGVDHVAAGLGGQFSTLAILALTSGGLTMIFFVLCVEQLTHFSREMHVPYSASNNVGTRFYGCKYLFALLVLGVSSSALIGDGVVSFMRVGALTPMWLDMPISAGTGVLEFACWSFVLVVIVIGVLEFRLRPYFRVARSRKFRHSDGDVDANFDSTLFARLRSGMRGFAMWTRVITALAVVACVVLRLLNEMPVSEFLLILPASAAAVIVVNAMFYSGLITLFFMQSGAFVVVTDVSIFEAAPSGTRLYLLSRQTEDPHRNMWIFPGGFMGGGQTKDPVGYIRAKLDLANVEARVQDKPFFRYSHLMPEEEVAYRGALYRAIPRGASFKHLPRTTEGSHRFCALTFDQMTSDLIPELIRNFAAEWERRSADEYAFRFDAKE